jgi:hypothetical protein
MVTRDIQMGLPEAKQLRGKETIHAILEATSKILFEQGESRIRIQEISAATNISIGSIYHHFGNREALVTAAFVNNFTQEFGKEVMLIKQVLDALKPADMGPVAKQRIKDLFNHHFTTEQVLHRIQILGNLATRPDLRNAVHDIQTQLIGSLTESIQRVQADGIVKKNMSARALALTAMGLLVGRVTLALDESGVSEDEWNDIVIEFFGGVLNPEHRDSD